MRVALLLRPLLTLQGLAITTASAGIDLVACAAFQSIHWSKNDTDETPRIPVWSKHSSSSTEWQIC
jgi:hypothetical protein